METFTFYINVDRCLNNSNYDMFFYKLRGLDRLAVFETESNDKDILETFEKVRDYLDQNASTIYDYRIIIGVRKQRIAHREIQWKDTILRLLLSVHKALIEMNIFTQSREKADKSISIITLYETDLFSEMADLTDYDVSQDVMPLERYLGFSLDDSVGYDQIEEHIKSKGSDYDDITRDILAKYISFLKNNEEVSALDNRYEGENEIIVGVSNEDSKESRRDNLISFTSQIKNKYSVFSREIDKNSRVENSLALLGLIDYITSDPDSDDKDSTRFDSLRMESERAWKNSFDDNMLKKKYGEMIAAYKNKLLEAIRASDNRIESLEHGSNSSVFSMPESLTGDGDLSKNNHDEYKHRIKEIVSVFRKKSWRRKEAETIWRTSFSELKEITIKLEAELKLFAERISEQYREKLRERDESSSPVFDLYGDEVYALDAIEKSIVEKRKEERSILDKIKMPRLIPSLSLQDKLNLNNQLEISNQEILFYTKCQRMIRMINYIGLFATSMVFFLIHYFILQNYVFSDSKMYMFMLICILSVVVIFAICFVAPSWYFRKHINKALEELEESMEQYIEGFFKKASDFSEYVSMLNQLDAVNDYVAKQEDLKSKTEDCIKKIIWHRERLEEHIKKADYFRGVVDDVGEMGGNGFSATIAYDDDIIHNELYWI